MSAATLAYEILLVRVFAIEHFHHFAYMAIGVAMLGFAATGTLVAVWGAPAPERRAGWFVGAAAATAFALIASPALVHLVALDPTRLAWDAREWTKLGLTYVLLALPFGLAALVTLLALSPPSPDRERGTRGEAQRGTGGEAPRRGTGGYAWRPGLVYGASFAGAGPGAAAALAALWVVPPQRALALPALLAGAGALAGARGAPGRVRGSLAVLALAAAAAAVVRPPWRLAVTPYKALPQVEAYPGARRTTALSSPFGWVVAVEAPAFRYAPGLSLGYAGAFPSQTGLFVDGDLAGAATHPSGEAAMHELTDWLPSALPYALGAMRRVLVLGAGGGIEVENAVAHGATAVTAVELSPDLVGLARGLGAGREPVEWFVGDARAYAARARERFDLIAIGPQGALGAAAAGVHALNEDFMHTVDAYAAYLRRLADGGVLAITRWLTVPPREPVRVVLTAAEALRRVRPDAAPPGLVVARSWGTVTVLARPSGFDPDDLAALLAWARARQFELDWYPGTPGPSATFHSLDEPTLHDAARAAIAGSDSARRFAAAYPFAVAPADDARPYPHHFLRPGALRTFVATSRGSWLPFAEWGFVALVATLAQSLVLGGLLVLAPLARRRARSGAGGARLVAYFCAIGLAYLAAELAAIQQLGLLLGHPVYAVAAALVVFLVCSGAGSALAHRFERGGRWPVVVIALGLVLYAAALLPLVHAVQPAAFPVRVAVATLALAPIATLMGLPFPTGLRLLVAGDTVRLAWAWAANGFASVVAAPLAALVALEAGSPALFLVAAGGYAVAALAAGPLRS